MIAAIALAALAAAPAPSVTRANGVTVVAQPDTASTLAGTMVFVRAGLDRQSFAQSGLAALTAGRSPTPSTGGPFRDAIAAARRFDRRVDRASLLRRRSARMGTVCSLFTAALRAPDFSRRPSAALAALDRTMGVARARHQAADARRGALERHAVSLAQFVPDDVGAFYARTYRIGGAVVSAVGAIGPATDYGAVLSSLARGGSMPVVAAIPVVTGASHQLISRRNIDVPWLVARYPAPGYGSADFGAMLVLASFVDRTLGEVAQLPTLISRTSADSAVGSIYAFDRPSANLTVYLYGGLGDPTQAFSTALGVFKAMGSAPVSGSLDEFKADARGRFARDIESLEDRAWIAGVFASNGGKADYLDRTFASIDAVTAADLRRVARRYLGDPTIALVLPR